MRTKSASYSTSKGVSVVNLTRFSRPLSNEDSCLFYFFDCDYRYNSFFEFIWTCFVYLIFRQPVASLITAFAYGQKWVSGHEMETFMRNSIPYKKLRTVLILALMFPNNEWHRLLMNFFEPMFLHHFAENILR